MGGYLSVPVTSPGVSPAASPTDKPDKANNKKDQQPANSRAPLRFDPRSISDNIQRTPIQVSGTNGKGQDTPKTAINRALQKRLKDQDPRSPSGIPRTPIVFRDEDEDSTKLMSSEDKENH